MRTFRRKTDGNKAQIFGGLGGFIIEGNPGVGKSDFVTATLVSERFEEVKKIPTYDSEGKLEYQFPDPTDVPKQAFYRMPINMDYPQKEELLLKALS